MEVMFSILLMTIGIVAVLSAISMAMLREKEGENKNVARQLTTASLESIFAVRDLRNDNALNSWNSINNTTVATGIFLPGWNPIRVDSGIDGIEGTADDACATGTNCSGTGGYSNTSEEITGYTRRIIITDVADPGLSEIRKKKVEISVRYFVGQNQRTETITTMVANLPFTN